MTEKKAPSQPQTKATKPDPKIIQEAIKIGQDLIKKEMTKSETAMVMYRLLHEGGFDQETIVDAFIKGASLTPMGARTYFYNCRRKYKSKAQAVIPKS